MSKAAAALAAAQPSDERVKRNGPTPPCRGLYDPDIEDADAILKWRSKATESWRTAQLKWDEILGIDATRRIPNDKFRYHWKRGCGCWPDDLRQR